MKHSATQYKRHRFPPEIIQYAVWLYYRFNLSHRDIEDLLARRGILVTHESIRFWGNKFGLCSAITRSRPRGRRQILVMQATVRRSDAHPRDSPIRWRVSGVAEGTKRPAGSASNRRTIQANAIIPQLGDGPATRSVRPRSNICGPQVARDCNSEDFRSFQADLRTLQDLAGTLVTEGAAIPPPPRRSGK